MSTYVLDTEVDERDHDLPPEDRQIVERLCTNAIANDASNLWGHSEDSSRRAWQLLSMLPERYGAHYQPFLGGGTAFWQSCFDARWKSAVLGDRNSDVIAAYEVVRDRSDELLTRILSLAIPPAKHKYQLADPSTLDPVGRVAQIIHLGVWADAVARDRKIRRRTNLQQHVYDMARRRVMACSTLLCPARGVRLVQCEFEDCVCSALPGDAALFSPPPTCGRDDHARLASVFRDLTSRGVHCVTSLPLRPELPELYEGYALHDLFGKAQKQRARKGRPPPPPIRPVVGYIVVGRPTARV
jgi:hypothetical protein